MHVLKKAGAQSAFGSTQNAIFWKKVAFWAKAENAQNIMKLWRSIKQKVHGRSELSVGLFLQLPNYPSHFTKNLTLPFDLGQTIFLSNISKLKHNQNTNSQT